MKYLYFFNFWMKGAILCFSHIIIFMNIIFNLAKPLLSRIYIIAVLFKIKHIIFINGHPLCLICVQFLINIFVNMFLQNCKSIVILTQIIHFYLVESSICPSGYFRCESGQCVNETYVCDAYRDCDDDSDEQKCG